MKTDFPRSFFENEVRSGFFVSSMMKRCWASALKILQEIDRICRLHEIRWFLYGGALLGAVRHQGFIPWDDDIDIIMLRADLERFINVAEKEMGQGCGVVDTRRQDGVYTAVVTVSNAGCSQKERVEQFYGYPFVASVDIMVLDDLHRDAEREAFRRKRLRDLDIAQELTEKGRTEDSVFEEWMKIIETDNHIVIRRDELLLTRLYRLEAEIISETVEEPEGMVECFFGPEDHYRYPKEWWEQIIYLPFERFSFPAPERFAEILKSDYNDYNKIVIGGASHEYPGYGGAERLFREKTGHNMLRYTVDKNDLFLPKVTPEEKAIAEMSEMLVEAEAKRVALREGGDEENADKLFLAMQAMKEKQGALTAREEALEENNDVVFLTCRAGWWPSLELLYRAFTQEKDKNVIVIPIPWYTRTDSGAWEERHDERKGYPDDILLTSPDDYRLAEKRPAVIVTNFPFDGSDLCVGIDQEYHTSYIRNLTKKLIYTPCFLHETPREGDLVSRTALRVLIEQPAVVYADQIVLPSKELCVLYETVLTEIAGEDTETVWNEKLLTLSEFME